MLRIAAASLCLLTAVGCKEDLTPATQAWAEAQAQLMGKAKGLRTAAADLKKRVSELPAVGAEDKAGQELKAKVDAELEAFEKAIGPVDAAVKKAAETVAESLSSGKVATVQAAIEAAKTSVEGAAAKIAEAPKTIGGLIDQLTAHLADAAKEAARLAEAAKVPAAPAAPALDATKKGGADYALRFAAADSDTLAADDAAVKAQLDAMVALLETCKEIQVELQSHTGKEGDAKANKALSAKRAKAVQAYLTGQKVAASKIKKASGMGSKEGTERFHLEILKPCKAAK